MLAALAIMLAGCDIVDVITGDECRPPPAGANVSLALEELQLLQATQLATADANIPLLAGSPLLVRTVITHNQGATEMSIPGQLRVTGFSGDLSIGGWTTPIGCIPGEADPQTTALTPSVHVPATSLRHNLRVLVEIMDENGTVVVSQQAPADALPPLSLLDPPAFAIHFVPLAMQGAGAVADLDHSAAMAALEMTTGLFPLRSMSVTVREPPYLYGGPWGEGDGTWLLQELRELQLLEDSRSYYHAIVPPGEFFTDVGGQGYIGWPAAYSRTYAGRTLSPAVVAHELGHNFSLVHADCGTEGKDPAYPYAGGVIGKFGFDAAGGRVYPPTTPDLMSYCGPAWISDYNYLQTIEFRAAEAEAAEAMSTAATARLVIISGQVAADDTVDLRPLLHSLGRAAPPAPGAWLVQLLDADGNVIQGARFSLTELSHSEVRSFAFSLPLAEPVTEALHGVRIIDPAGNTAVERIHDALASQALDQVFMHVTAVRTPAGSVLVTWPAAAFETVLILDPASGTVLARGNSGNLSLDFAGPELDLLVSTGVRAERYRVPVTGRPRAP